MICLPNEAWVVDGSIGYLDAQIDELKEFSVVSTGGNSSLSTGSGYAEIAYARPREYYAMFEYDF